MFDLEKYMIPAEEGFSNKNLKENHIDKKNIDAKYHFSNMTEEQYNNFFLKVKSDSFKICKNLEDKFNADSSFLVANNNYNIKVIKGTYKVKGMKFTEVPNGFNKILFVVIQYNHDYEKNTFPKAIEKELQNKYADLLNSGIIKLDIGSSGGYIKFLHYNAFIKI